MTYFVSVHVCVLDKWTEPIKAWCFAAMLGQMLPGFSPSWVTV